MSDSHTTATLETTNAAPTAHLPVRENQMEAEVDRSQVAGQRVMRSIGGGSPDAPPEKFSGVLGAGAGGLWRQMQRGYGNQYVGQVIQRKCDDCEKKDEKIQRKGDGDLSTVPDGFEAAMQQGGSGQPLDDGTRSFMESRFGQDFGDVKVHTDGAAAEASKQIQAQAFTTGRDIYFGRGRFQPEATEGKKLLAHELTHVVQQNIITTAQNMAKPILGSSGDVFEKEADAVANQVVSGNVVISGAKGSAATKTLSLISRQNSIDLSVDLIQRQEANADVGGGASSVSAPASIPGAVPISSSPSPIILSARKLIDDALKSKDVGDVKRIRNFGLASEDEKITLIGILLDQFWVGPDDEYALEAIWGSFGDRVIKVASDHLSLWNQCIEKGAEIEDLPAIKKLKDQFKADVITTATRYLDRNKEYAANEMKRLGLEDLNKPVSPEQNESLQKIPKIAEEVRKANEASLELKTWIFIGYRRGSASAFRQKSTNYPITNEQTDLIPVRFDPEKQPDVPPRGDEVTPMPSWEKTKEKYDNLQAVITGHSSRYPAIYALSRDKKIDEIAKGGDQTQIRKTIAESLNDVLENINKTYGRLSPDDKFPLELLPIHTQLFKSDTFWKQPFPQAVAKNVVKDYQDSEFWKTLGLGALQLALFVIAEIATGGLATFALGLGVGISAGQAISSWEKYQEAQAASRANLSDETALLSEGQATSALVGALLDTVFAFLDVYAAGKGILKAARAGETAAETGGRTLEDLSKAEKQEAKALGEATEAVEHQEGNILRDKVKNPDNIKLVEDPDLLAKGYDVEVQVGEHTYRRKPDGSWCRFSKPKCGFYFGPDVEKAIEASGRFARRPHWRQSEKYVEDLLGEKWKPQPSYFEGKPSSSNKFGSTKPDVYNKKLNIAGEVKNYDLVNEYDNLIKTLLDQAGGRIANMPPGVKQWLFLDIRGQKITGLAELSARIKKATGAFERIHFITEAGVVAF